MTRLPLITLFMTVALLAPSAHAGHVLGPDAESPVMSWLTETGAKLESVTIDRGVVVAKAKGCTLTLSHATVTGCAAPFPSGNTTICRDGTRCPSDRALSRAGALTLPWRGAERDADEASDTARSALRAARVEAQRRFAIGQVDAARNVLLPVIAQSGHRALDLLDLAVTLTGTGGSAAVLDAMRAGRFTELPPALRAALTVAAQLGPRLGATVLTALVTPPMACQATEFAAGLEVVHGHETATVLTRRIRQLAPTCFEAYAIEAEMLATLRDQPAATAVIQDALRRFPDHPGQARLEELALGSAGDEAGLIALYERRLASGDRSPGLFSVLFSHYVKHGVMKDRVERYMTRAERDPDDDVAALVAGVLLHYEKKFARSNALVERAAPKFPTEPRVYIYQAMNHFNLGDRARAEAFIAKAEALEVADPDVYYCIGEIYRDTDRSKALAGLDVYWHMTAVSGGHITEKQARVRGMMEAIARCRDQQTPAPCPGPFEHTFGSATPRPQ